MKRNIVICLVLSVTGFCQAQQLTLDQCLDLARNQNRTLQNAALEIQSARENQKEMYTKYFPQISANVTAFQAFDKIMKSEGVYPDEIAALGENFAALAGQPYAFSELNRSYGVTLSVMEPVYAGGQVTTGNKLAALQTDVCKLQLQMKEKDLLQKVRENFWQIATIRYNLQTLDAADKELDAVMTQVQSFVDAGVSTRNALLQVKLRKQELASSRLKLENGSHILRMLLAQQVGLSADSVPDLLIPEAVLPQALPAPADMESAVGDRQEYQLIGKAVESQQLLIRLERGKLLPTVAAGLMGYNTGMGGFSDRFSPYVQKNLTNAMALLTVSIPVSDWWGGSHAVKRRKIQLQQAENDRQDAHQSLTVDIQSAWSNLTEAFKQIELAKASVEEAEENLRMLTDQYKTGTVTLTDWLDAETLNRKSQNQLSQACADYQVRLADYIRKTNP